MKTLSKIILSAAGLAALAGCGESHTIEEKWVF